jgi:hypothetical protein
MQQAAEIFVPNQKNANADRKTLAKQMKIAYNGSSVSYSGSKLSGMAIARL